MRLRSKTQTYGNCFIPLATTPETCMIQQQEKHLELDQVHTRLEENTRKGRS